MTEYKLNRLIEIVGLYKTEAEKCFKAGAYYAACVFQGATLEGILITVLGCVDNKVNKYISKLKRSQKKYPRGQVINWHLKDLIKVAKGIKFIPLKIYSKKYKQVFKVIPAMHFVREIRNYIHIVLHVRNNPKTRLDSRYYRISRNITNITASYLEMNILKEINISKKRKYKLFVMLADFP